MQELLFLRFIIFQSKRTENKWVKGNNKAVELTNNQKTRRYYGMIEQTCF